MDIEGYDVAAFLAHQAAEKAIKAALILKRGEAPKSHYLDELSKMLPLPEELQEKVLNLVPDYTLSRYPDVSEKVPYEQYDYAIAREKVEVASEVVEFVRRNFPEVEGG